MTTQCAIETDRLRKVFGNRVAVQGLSLQVARGEVFGFLGPNGAGKTTSVKMLLGLTIPTSGSARMLGAPLGDQETRRRVGFLPEHLRFQDWLSADEFLTFHGQLYAMSPEHLRARITELLELLGLSDFRHKPLRTFSKGMTQRVGLAQALLNEPEIVFLDEPTSGLDPLGRLLVRDIIHNLRARGTCVFLNSHLLSEVEVTCDRVAFVRRGEVVRVTELTALSTGQLHLNVRVAGITPQILAGLERWSHDVRSTEGQLGLTVESEEAVADITHFLIEQGARVYAVVPQRPSLEELFVEAVGGEESL